MATEPMSRDNAARMFEEISPGHPSGQDAFEGMNMNESC